jgi:hypothetical protein
VGRAVQIVPRLPPAVDGLGDYALCLARQLRDDHEIESSFIVGDPSWEGGGGVEGFSGGRLSDRSAAALAGSLGSDDTRAVLLHYVGYGYAKRGAPFWLIRGLERWRGNNSRARLLTIFHEIAASGPPWTSAFWLSPLQRRLAARLVRLSDTCVTSKQSYAEILQSLSSDRGSIWRPLPVFSTIGEPKTPLPLLRHRRRRLVVFGGAANKARVYARSLPAIERSCGALAIDEIVDIGPPSGRAASSVAGVPVIEMGRLPAAEISALLSESLAGFFNYNTAYLAKSSIFAAYCSHRLLPVSAPREVVAADGLEPGRHYYVAAPHEPISITKGQEVADSAHAWYQTHKLSEQAKAFAAEIRRC